MPNKKSLFFLFVAMIQVINLAPLHASFENKEIGSAYLGCGGSGVAALDGSFRLFRNPAAIFFSKNRRLDVFFKNYYGLSGLNLAAVGLSFKPLGLPAGLGFWQYGNKLYHENALRLSAVWGIGQNFSLALQGDILNLWIKNYGSATGLALGLAALYRLTKKINFGLRMENLNRPQIGHSQEILPLQMVSGISYSPQLALTLFADVLKESRTAFDYRFGMEYQFSRRLMIRGGFRTLTNSYAVGISLFAGKADMAYGFEYHPQLSFSHSLSVGYAF